MTSHRTRAKVVTVVPGAHAALYARVSTTDQTAENQLAALRAFAAARG